jgi:hypothetical protein
LPSSVSSVGEPSPDAAASASTATPKAPRHGASYPRVPVASPTATRSAQPAAECDPPYYFNSQGARVFKPECL